MLADLLISLQWWLVLFILGVIFFPLTSLLFPKFIDKGYAFSKTSAVLLLSYTVFVLGSLHIVKFSFVNLILLVVFYLLTSFILRKKYPVLFSYLLLFKENRKLILTEEIVFLSVFLFWSYVRAFAPDINGLEKFMDYGFVNSILRSDYFPAKDMWFTPLSINYYYFGHFVTAVLTKLSLLPSSYTYNLMIATLAALTFIGSFSLGINLSNFIVQKKNFLKIIIVGLLSAFLVTFAGNLHTLYTFFKPYENESPVPPWELAFSPQSFPNSYWYPNATRFIYHTIHEFPIYSWVVSDLHGHVTDIPFVLLTIAFIFSLLITHHGHKIRREKKTSQKRLLAFYQKLSYWLPINPLLLLFLSFIVSCMYMTNAWDGLIYILLSCLLIAFLEWQKIRNVKIPFLTKLISLLLEMVIPVVVLGGGFILFSLPFSLFFKPFVSGIGVLCAPEVLTNLGNLGPLLFEADHCQHSPWWQLLILYGFFYFFVMLLLTALSQTKKWLVSDVFVILLILLSTLLIIVPEFIYAKDIYPAHYRANTMFKLVFQAFIMLSLVSGYSIARVSALLKSKSSYLARMTYLVFFLCSLSLLTLVFLYPYFSITSYYGNIFACDPKTDKMGMQTNSKECILRYKGLDGLAYLHDRYEDDAKAIEWLHANIKGQPVVLEAQGDSYTDYARVSANTGLPTVLGWTVHEWLWRGNYSIPAPRIDEVKQMYESDNLTETKRLLNKYNVVYVFIGQLEREKYSVYEKKFEDIGEIVYRSRKTSIFKIQ